MYDRAVVEQAFGVGDPPPARQLACPHFLALPALIEESNLAAIVPRPLAKAVDQSFEIAIHELPYTTKSLQVHLLWHERLDEDS